MEDKLFLFLFFRSRLFPVPVKQNKISESNYFVIISLD